MRNFLKLYQDDRGHVDYPKGNIILKDEIWEISLLR